MTRPTLRMYLDSIQEVELPKTTDRDLFPFLCSVKNSWGMFFHSTNYRTGTIHLNFYLLPERNPGVKTDLQVDYAGGLDCHLHHAVHGETPDRKDVRKLIPREIYDAGLAIIYNEDLRHDFDFDVSSTNPKKVQRLMTATVMNMLEAVQEYRSEMRVLRAVRV